MRRKPGKVEQLTVYAYRSHKRKGKGRRKDFTFFVNPDELSTQHVNQYQENKSMHHSGRTATYALSVSDRLSLQLILDNTLERAARPGMPSGSIREQVSNFMKACFYMDGHIHEPRYLVVAWGEIRFECRLESVNIAYSHFDEKGDARRATLQAVFIEDVAKGKRVKLENKRSPDITHTRQVLQGDTLPGLSKQVYGDAKHYLMLAEFNGLNHFRSLAPGMLLHFPPLEKPN